MIKKPRFFYGAFLFSLCFAWNSNAMNYHHTTHCPNCFKPSSNGICPHCNFDRDKYIKEQASNHHLPLFTRLDKGYVIGRVLGEGGFAIVYAALRMRRLSFRWWLRMSGVMM